MNRFRFHTLVLAALAIWPAVGSAQHAPVVDQAGSLDQSVSVQQIGTATAVDVAQQAPLARAELGLAGERLAASLRQQGQADAGFALLMEGSDGLVDAIQSGDAGGSNVASVWQSGAGNSALLDQYASAGMPNHVALIQDGTANIAFLTQSGEGNSLDLAQRGADNFAAIDQIGSGLGLSLSQLGGASVSITQTGGR